MKAKLQSAALLATARIVFGSSPGGAALRAGAWGLGLLGCGGQATSDEPKPRAVASSSAGTTTGPSVGGAGNAGGGGADGSSAGAAGGGSSAGDGSQGGTASSGGYGSATSGGSGGNNGGGNDSGGNNGGGNDSGGGNSGGASGGTLGGEASSGGSSTGEPPPICVGPTELTVPSLAPGPSEEELRCCLARVSTATSDWRSPEGDEIMKSAPIVDCCRAIVTAVDLGHALYKQASRVHAPCCSRYVGEPPDIFQHLLCTPWGPPMPPALDWRAA
jgi:hypothetical protein